MNNFLNNGKVQPQNMQVEKAVLGTILIDKNAFDIVSDILTSDCFYADSSQLIFKAMCDLVGRNMPVDLLTVVEQLRINESLELVGGPYYLTTLSNDISGSNVEAHARIVLEKFIAREAIRVCIETINDAYDDSVDVFDMLDMAERNVMAIGTKHISAGMIPMVKVLYQARDKIQEWSKCEGNVTGIPTGFSELDTATRGWQPGDLIVLGARPSKGKTALALNIAMSAGKSGNTTALWSLEMKAVYLAIRMLSAQSKIYMQRLQIGKLDDEYTERLEVKGYQELSKYPLFFDEGSKVNIRTVTAKARRLKKKNKLKLIIIDYLQLMSGLENKGNREQEIAKISRDLKNLATELQVPIIILSQLTRDSEKTTTWDNGPQITSLRESGSIEQDADLIMLLWGATDAEIEEDRSLEGKRKLKIAKQRNGVLLTIELDFKTEIQLFESLEDNSRKPSGNFIPVSRVLPKEDRDELPF